MGQAALVGAVAHLREQADAVAVGAYGDPQRAFEFVILRRGQPQGRVGMADLAAEAQLLLHLDLVQHAPAIGAGDAAGLARRDDVGFCHGKFRCGDAVLGTKFLGQRDGRRGLLGS
ncbi:hypothetical protein [Sphingomonas xinjiangensis]|uniref:Uncharacterized protein n=1 Tax=Sphingomonas xinjiangensis TaxID=643568 RepID=A0A840YP41_9SPHN|nr:hypothetical protein [Sphingomonas xinjiangensis]MBB5711920.1 hypothetical protein [Sphingomonas xinjiangensis]